MFYLDPLNADGSWTFKTLAPPRKGDVAPLDIFFNLGGAIGSSGSCLIVVKISTVDHLNTNSWSLSTIPTYTCRLKNLATSADIPCQCSMTSNIFTLTVFGTVAAVMIFFFNIRKPTLSLFDRIRITS